MTDYASRRDAAAEAHAEKFWGERSEIDEPEELNAFENEVDTFKAGADWARKESNGRDEYFDSVHDEVERLERELASEVSRHVETDKSYKHWRDKANHLTAERDAIKAQAEKLAGAAFAVCSSEEVDSANEVFGERLDKLSEALAAWREFEDKGKQGEEPKQED